MKRLLLVTSRFPYPPVGGDRLRVFHLARLLARHYEVELVSLGPELVSGDTLQAFRRASGVAAARSIEQPRWRSLLGAVKALLSGKPLQAGYFASPGLQRAFDEAVGRADLVIAHLIRTSALWHRQRPIPAMLDMCDAISQNLLQVVEEGSSWASWTWVARLEAPRLVRFERAQAASFDLVSFVATADMEALGLAEPRAMVLTQGVDLDAYPYTPPTQRSGHKIALIGKMDTYPNRSAALWAAETLIPLLPPPLSLKLVGDCPPGLQRQLEAYPRVEVSGRVDSIAEACADCFASIAPLDVATGIQNKALESFAMGLPTILSPSVARGLLPQAARVHRIAGSAREWAAELLALRDDPAEADRLTALARWYVEQHHSWDAIGQTLYARLEQLSGVLGADR